MRANENGFTLVETVLMLLVISLIVMIPILSIDKMTESIQIDLFFRELTSNITMTQNHAILNGESTEIAFIHDQGKEYIDFIVALNPEHPLNKRMELDSPYYQFRSGKSRENLYLKYKKDTGNISKAGSLTFDTTKGNYKITFWLGSGRFEINKTTNQ